MIYFATFYPSPLAMHQFPADPSSSWDRKNPSQHCPGHWARVQFLQNGHWQRTVIVTKCHQLFVRSWQILFHEDVSLLKIPVGHDSLCFHRSSSGFSTAQPSLSPISKRTPALSIRSTWSLSWLSIQETRENIREANLSHGVDQPLFSATTPPSHIQHIPTV